MYVWNIIHYTNTNKNSFQVFAKKLKDFGLFELKPSPPVQRE